MKSVERIRSSDRPAAIVILAGEGAVDAPTRAVGGRKECRAFILVQSG